MLIVFNSFNKMSDYRNIQLPKCPVTKMSVAQLSMAKVSFTKMSGYPPDYIKGISCLTGGLTAN